MHRRDVTNIKICIKYKHALVGILKYLMYQSVFTLVHTRILCNCKDYEVNMNMTFIGKLCRANIQK